MFNIRLRQLKANLKKEKLDAVFISSIANIEYLTGYSNFSKDEREAYVFIGENFGYIVTDGRYSEAIKKAVPHLTLFERGHKQSIEKLFKKHQTAIKKLGIEEDNLTVSEHKTIKKHFKNLQHFEIGNLRSIKSNDEIKKIKKAAKLGDKAFMYILQKIKDVVSEKQVADEIESFIKQQGGEFSFPAIVAFGKNSSIPHHQTGDTKLKKGDFVLLDFGVKFENYCSDMTRTIFLGKPKNEQKKIYDVVLKAQEKAVDFINSSVKTGKKIKAKEVDRIARDYIKLKRYPDIPHSLGHGVGLEVHEHPSLSPKSKDILKERMVFSIEPGIYIPNFGGVRIEDLFVLRKDRVEKITNSSKELIIL